MVVWTASFPTCLSCEATFEAKTNKDKSLIAFNDHTRSGNLKGAQVCSRIPSESVYRSGMWGQVIELCNQGETGRSGDSYSHSVIQRDWRLETFTKFRGWLLETFTTVPWKITWGIYHSTVEDYLRHLAQYRGRLLEAFSAVLYTVLIVWGFSLVTDLRPNCLVPLWFHQLDSWLLFLLWTEKNVKSC